jgi:hypothetical protein
LSANWILSVLSLPLHFQDLRLLEDRIEGLTLSEQRAHSAVADAKIQVKRLEQEMQDCQESKEAELEEAKLKLQAIKTEDESKLNKEREDSRQKLEEMKVKYDEKIRELKEEINVKEAHKKKLMDNMISKELYKRDLDNLKIQNQTALVCFIFTTKF